MECLRQRVSTYQAVFTVVLGVYNVQGFQSQLQQSQQALQLTALLGMAMRALIIKGSSPLHITTKTNIESIKNCLGPKRQCSYDPVTLANIHCVLVMLLGNKSSTYGESMIYTCFGPQLGPQMSCKHNTQWRTLLPPLVREDMFNGHSGNFELNKNIAIFSISEVNC